MLFAAALALFAASPARVLAVERIHYVAADEVLWDYAPQHQDVIAGRPLPSLGPYQFGWSYHKAIYREYTDGTFATLRQRPLAEAYLGLVGPVIHAQVGDTVVIVFRNNTQFPLDVAVNGIASHPAPAAVAPGKTVRYVWPITAADGPSQNDGSSVLYVYQSDVTQTAAENAGLIGPLIVTRRGAARADGSPKDVDQEVVTLFSADAETRSLLFASNLADPAVNPKHLRVVRSPLFLLSNAFPTINGFSFGNMPMPVLKRGAHVRWYLLSTQNDIDGHLPTWDGQTVVWQGNRVDSLSLVAPHTIADMVPDNPGIWLLVCTLNVHLEAGMEARYQVVASKS